MRGGGVQRREKEGKDKQVDRQIQKEKYEKSLHDKTKEIHIFAVFVFYLTVFEAPECLGVGCCFATCSHATAHAPAVADAQARLAFRSLSAPVHRTAHPTAVPHALQGFALRAFGAPFYFTAPPASCTIRIFVEFRQRI